MIKELKDYFTLFLLLMDLPASVAAFALSALIASDAFQTQGAALNAHSFFQTWQGLILIDYHHYLFLILLAPLLLVWLDRMGGSGCAKEAKRYFSRSAIAAGLTGGIGLLAGIGAYSFKANAGFMSSFVFISFVLFIVNRFFFRWLIMAGDKQKNGLKQWLIVGTGQTALKLARCIDANPECGPRVVGFISRYPEEVDHEFGKHRVVCTVENFAESLKSRVVDCVLFIPDPAYLPYVDQLYHRCRIEGADFGFLSSRPFVNKRGVFMEKIGDFHLVILKSVIQHPVKLAVKRIFDFVCTTILIFALLPLWLVIALMIKLDSKGPVFYRQERVGKNGRRFIMYKFRSMVVGAERYQSMLQHLNEMDGPAFKIKNDPRQTKVGRILRQSSLDELPQLFNVFKGDISLVGPRPPIYEEVKVYRPWEKKRLSVIPGITCLWQVSGRNNVKFDEWMKLDLMYIENWSFANDLKILLKTIPAVISREGAR